MPMQFYVVRTGRRFLSDFSVGRLSKRGPRGFEHNAAQSARFQRIQAKIRKEE